MRLFFYLVVLCVIGGLAWIRFAPSDPAYWNVDPQVTADQDLADGVRRRIPGGEPVFERLNAIILATPRTEVLDGSVSEGQVTYITRSQWMGFPDYTTVKLSDGVLELWARLRFGRADMGVNRDRVEGWLAQLGAGRDG